MKLLSLLFIFCYFAINAHATEISPFRANYEFRVNGITVGETIFELSKNGDNRLIYSHSTRPSGILAGIQRERKERSILILDNGQPRPLEFSGRNALRSKPREGYLHFDWRAGKVTGTWNGQPWQAQLEDSFHDPLSYQLAIMFDLAQGKRILNYLIAEDAKIKPYHFRVTGQAIRETLAGQFDTLRVERTQDSDKRNTTLWCAPTLNYLPIEVEQQDSGTNYTMVLRTIVGLKPTPNAK